MFIHLFRSLTHSPHLPYHPPTTQSPQPKTYTREFASPTHPEIQARYPLSKDLSLDVKKKKDIYRADDSKRAYTMIVVNSITVTMFRRDV